LHTWTRFPFFCRDSSPFAGPSVRTLPRFNFSSPSLALLFDRQAPDCSGRPDFFGGQSYTFSTFFSFFQLTSLSTLINFSFVSCQNLEFFPGLHSRLFSFYGTRPRPEKIPPSPSLLFAGSSLRWLPKFTIFPLSGCQVPGVAFQPFPFFFFFFCRHPPLSTPGSAPPLRRHLQFFVSSAFEMFIPLL